MTLELSIIDSEGDNVVLAIRLANGNYSVDLGDCAVALNSNFNSSCSVDISKELIPRKVNRHDWRFEVVAIDDNSSVWTEFGISLFHTENFTIWWENPAFIEPDVWPQEDEVLENKQNDALLLGILGFVIGALVAASVMFRGVKRNWSEDVKSPFREEE